MVSPAKVLVIGLDSVDAKLLLRWCDSGELPVLRALREKGVEGKLTSLPALGDDAVWASFYTTVSPARHGRYFWQHFQNGSYGLTVFRDEHLRHEPFWQSLCRAGRKVGIVDVPKCPLSEDLNGFQLADWLVHGRDHATCSRPLDLAATILTQFGDDRTDRTDSAEWLCRMETLSEDEHEILLQRLLDSIERKREAATQLLSQGGYDLFLAVFKEGHCAGHQFWHLLDELHPQHDAALARKLGDPLKSIYKSLDNAVGELLALVDRDTSVIVFTDLGMGPNYTGEPFLDEILIRLESSTPTNWQSLYRRATRAAQAIRAKCWGDPGRHPHAQRKAFQLPHNEISGAIRVNLKGREPAGRIRPGREFEEFCQTLSQDLLSLTNPDTGAPIVDEVLRTDALFDGDHRNELPDLFVVWRRDSPITAVASPKIGELRVRAPSYRTGNHVPDGIYIGTGPFVAVPRQHCPASIMDIGPTIAMLLNAPLGDTEGKPIAALCGGQN